MRGRTRGCSHAVGPPAAAFGETRPSSPVAAGAAFVPFNNPGLRANTLLDGSLAVAAEVAPAVPLEVAPAGGEG